MKCYIKCSAFLLGLLSSCVPSHSEMEGAKRRYYELYPTGFAFENGWYYLHRDFVESSGENERSVSESLNGYFVFEQQGTYLAGKIKQYAYSRVVRDGPKNDFDSYFTRRVVYEKRAYLEETMVEEGVQTNCTFTLALHECPEFFVPLPLFFDGIMREENDSSNFMIDNMTWVFSQKESTESEARFYYAYFSAACRFDSLIRSTIREREDGEMSETISLKRGTELAPIDDFPTGSTGGVPVDYDIVWA